MSPSDTPSQVPSGDERRRRERLEELEIEEREFSLRTKREKLLQAEDARFRRARLEAIEIEEREFALKRKREQQNSEPYYRGTGSVIVLMALFGIYWTAHGFIADRKELAIRHIQADIRIAELNATAAAAPLTASTQTASSLARAPDISIGAQVAFTGAVKGAIARETEASTAGRVVATAASILEALVKAGKVSKAEAAAISRDLMKAGIDVTKDVMTEFGKAGVHALLDDKKADDKKEANGKSGMSITGNVVNYLSCAAPANKKAIEPTPPPSSPKPSRKPQKSANCPTAPGKGTLPMNSSDS